MRQIGSVPNLEHAERFADYLRADGVACSIAIESDGYRIWVHEDDHVPAARQELPQFLADPEHERYRSASRRAKARLQAEQLRRNANRAPIVDVSEQWIAPTIGSSPMIMALVSMTVFVALITGLNPKFNDPGINRLFYSSDGTFHSILRGEVWRILTPMFLHFNLMHIVFNMLMTYQLGLEIETRRGSLKFAGIVLAIAALSNTAQFWFGGQAVYGHWLGNPHFGGMSGVAYGLFGYSWIKGRLDPASGFDVPQQTVTMMMVWYVLCVLEIIPQVANWCHGVGLVTGVLIAAFGTWIQPWLRRK